MLKCFSNIQSNIVDVFLNSAHGINRIGIYSSCIRNPEMTYNMATFESIENSLIQLTMGFCLPSSCQPDQTKTIFNYLLSQFKLQFKAVDVDNTVEGFEYQYNWIFFLTIILLTSFTLLSIIYSFSKQKSDFALNKNIQIFSYKSSPLNVFNGIRSFAMLWVIFGHEYFFNLEAASNILTAAPILETPYFLFIEAGMFAVDTFFFLGGFMAAYVLLREKSFSFFTYPLAILNRVLRIWPSYIIAILIFYSILMHLGDGPIWHIWLDQVYLCDNMWRALLFIDNFVDNGTEMCMNWGWYLQNDMQMFAFSALLILFYKRDKFFGSFSIILTIVISFAFTMTYNYTHNYKVPIHFEDFGPEDTSFQNIYIKPYSRCPPYLIGLLLGIGYMELVEAQKEKRQSKMLTIKHKLNSSKFYEKGCQLIGIIIILFIVCIPRTSQLGLYWSTFVNAFYLTYSKSLFVIGITFLILPSLLGCPSIMKSILDTEVTNFISKVSFFTYLIHLNLIQQWVSSRKVEFYFSSIPLLGTFVSHAIMSLLIAGWLTLIVEIPFSKMQKRFMSSLLSKK